MAIKEVRDKLDVTLNSVINGLDVYRSERTISAPIAGVVHHLTVRGEGQLIAGGSGLDHSVRFDFCG
ncbi:MAG: hypothetical protein R3C68_13340 [Myxococcota bacterium]